MERLNVSAKQKGEIGEALLNGHIRKTTETVEPWLITAVTNQLQGAEESTTRVVHEPRVETFYSYFEGDHMSWTPDLQYIVRIAKSFGSLQSSNERRIDVPVEVKTGKYAELERNQRTVMELLATESECFPVVATVELDGLPSEFGVEFRTVPEPAGGN